MAITNLLQPNGLSVARNQISGSNTYQTGVRTIRRTYGSNIGMGDLVKAGAVADEGYIALALTTDTNALGVFAGVLPYYDTVFQQAAYGQNGAYQSTSSPSGDIPCEVIVDPFVTFLAQVAGGPFLQTWVGKGINFTSGTNGAPNISGRSTLSLDAATVGVDPTLPFQIVGIASAWPGGLQVSAADINTLQSVTNPWIEVRLNTAQMLNPTGA